MKVIRKQYEYQELGTPKVLKYKNFNSIWCLQLRGFEQSCCVIESSFKSLKYFFKLVSH